MSLQVCTDAPRIARWVSDQAHDADPCYTLPATFAVGVEQNGVLNSGLLCYDYTGTNVWCHIAVTIPTPLFLRETLRLLFEKLQVKRATFPVFDDNELCLRLVKGLGADLECDMKDGHPGGSLLLFVLWANTGVHRRYAGKLGEIHGNQDHQVHRA